MELCFTNRTQHPFAIIFGRYLRWWNLGTIMCWICFDPSGSLGLVNQCLSNLSKMDLIWVGVLLLQARSHTVCCGLWGILFLMETVEQKDLPQELSPVHSMPKEDGELLCMLQSVFCTCHNFFLVAAFLFWNLMLSKGRVVL